MQLLEFVGAISIIHLRKHEDRYRSLENELRYLGIDIRAQKVEIPVAPVVESPAGWPSNGVYGNFLSHHAILKDALERGLPNVMVLEDDALFSRRFRDQQASLVELLSTTEWDLCFPGHRLSFQLWGKPRGLIRSDKYFAWAHCYLVNQRALPRLVTYLEEVIANEAGHPRGGRMHIDAAFTHFRRQNPDIVTYVSNPAWSVQKGCVSSLGARRWYDEYPVAQPLLSRARSFRDECWRLL